MKFPTCNILPERKLKHMDEPTIISALTDLLNRKPETHKYDYGHVLVVGGSDGMIGAPMMAGLAALRTGAGLVTITSESANMMQGHVPELMTVSLPPGDTDYAVKTLNDYITDRNVSVVIAGPGLGTAAAPSLRQFVESLSLPTVLDAAGLIAFEDNLDDLTTNGKRNEGLILTPHSGEFKRLLDSTKLSEADHAKTLHRFAADHHVTVMLKGFQTLVANPGSADVYRNSTGNPGMATAGSGDVLTGVIAALCGQGLEPFIATCAAVYLHGLAGDLAAKDKTQPGLIASDIIDYLPAAFASLI
jgi:hydroxyethylthiazole kinase-like uncharacterized protein yjeF